MYALRVVLCLLTVLTFNGVAALRCKCSTSKGASECDGDYCDVHGREGKRAACGALRVGGETHFACVLIKQSSNDTYCHVVKSATACWCRERDFCNAELEAELFDVEPSEDEAIEKPHDATQTEFDIVSSDEFFAADTRANEPKLEAATPMDAVEHVHLTAANKPIIPSLSPTDFFDSYEDELEDEDSPMGWDVIAISPSRIDANKTDSPHVEANVPNVNLLKAYAKADSQRAAATGSSAASPRQISHAHTSSTTPFFRGPSDNAVKQLESAKRRPVYDNVIRDENTASPQSRSSSSMFVPTTTARTTTTEPTTVSRSTSTMSWMTTTATTTVPSSTVTTTRALTTSSSANLRWTANPSTSPRTLLRLLPPPSTTSKPSSKVYATTTERLPVSESKTDTVYSSRTTGPLTTTPSTTTQATRPAATRRTPWMRVSTGRGSLLKASSRAPTTASSTATLPSVRHMASPTVIYPQLVPKTALDKGRERDSFAPGSSAIPNASRSAMLRLYLMCTLGLILFLNAHCC